MNKKIFALIMGIILLLTGGVMYYGISKGKETTAFYGDGYVLEYTEDDYGDASAMPLYFNAGTRYKKSYSGDIKFKDIDGNTRSCRSDSFIHYADGSISTFEDSVILEFNELNDGLLNYYKVGRDSIMVK